MNWCFRSLDTNILPLLGMDTHLEHKQSINTTFLPRLLLNEINEFPRHFATVYLV